MHRFDLDQFKRTEMKITFRYQLVGLPCRPFFAPACALVPLLGEEHACEPVA